MYFADYLEKIFKFIHSKIYANFARLYGLPPRSFYFNKRMTPISNLSTHNQTRESDASPNQEISILIQNID